MDPGAGGGHLRQGLPHPQQGHQYNCPHPEKEYALKQYNRSQLEKHHKYQSLIRSLYILHSLNHPGVIRCVNYMVPPHEDLAIYTLFEACKRGSLENIKKPLRGYKQFTLIKLIMLDLAETLHYLKLHNVAHRDLKVTEFRPSPRTSPSAARAS